MTDQCALDANGNLKSPSKIKFYHDADDDMPMVGPEAAPKPQISVLRALTVRLRTSRRPSLYCGDTAVYRIRKQLGFETRNSNNIPGADAAKDVVRITVKVTKDVRAAKAKIPGSEEVEEELNGISTEALCWSRGDSESSNSLHIGITFSSECTENVEWTLKSSIGESNPMKLQYHPSPSWKRKIPGNSSKESEEAKAELNAHRIYFHIG
ncbi:uncharacterized protein EV420DRAFT_1486884 [Desarmillaria tabescens]|uniref:Uncharacterized protein n=1 Tax=Armillaria tabescens TaxID=1929756 RepID=A0AA39JC11_ARMTA|nr:uncharacterized protein EV420DRAFT_1486884 [Desarmillaria tabescens]KAK0437923.1 hypothetical protein EV420DRAFT_1486884 [Desarmillaria tabescens]